MSETETESKLEESSTTRNEILTSESNQGMIYENEYMSSSKAHNIYSRLICREDNKKKIPSSNQEMKDFDQLKKSKKNIETSNDANSILITFTKRVNDCYKVNPIEILDKKTTKEMNNNARKKVAKKTEAFCDYMGSKKTQHALKNYQSKPTYVDKVTNNPAGTIKKSIMENRKTQPFYQKYKFQHYIVDNKNHVSFVK